MKEMIAENQNLLFQAMEALSAYMSKNDSVPTVYQIDQYTRHGYQMERILFFGKDQIRFDVYMLDRSKREDDLIRGGDKASFYYDGKIGLIEECEAREARIRREYGRSA